MEFLFRIKADPFAHLGRKSLLALIGYYLGYTGYRHGQETVPEWRGALRNSLQDRYGEQEPSQGPERILMSLAGSDERAFDLFFEELRVADSAMGSSISRASVVRSTVEPRPVSTYLENLRDKPAMYFGTTSVTMLRGFVDGYSLAADEDGRSDCADLSGFESWLRNLLQLRGAFRWESFFLAAHSFRDEAAFDAAMSSLLAFRDDSSRKEGRKGLSGPVSVNEDLRKEEHQNAISSDSDSWKAVLSQRFAEEWLLDDAFALAASIRSNSREKSEAIGAVAARLCEVGQVERARQALQMVTSEALEIPGPYEAFLVLSELARAFPSRTQVDLLMPLWSSIWQKGIECLAPRGVTMGERDRMLSLLCRVAESAWLAGFKFPIEILPDSHASVVRLRARLSHIEAL
jgi:hypothetical protein